MSYYTSISNDVRVTPRQRGVSISPAGPDRPTGKQKLKES